MRFLITLAVGLALLTLESVAVRLTGLSVTRIDVTVAMISFLALRATPMEGAFCAFTLGYLLDLMSGRPTGLYTFLGVLVFLGGRVAASLVEVRSVASFVLFATIADLGHSVLAWFFSWLTSKGQSGMASLAGLPSQLLLTALAAALLYPLLRRLDPGADRQEKLGSFR